jgi:hypothetical protein
MRERPFEIGNFMIENTDGTDHFISKNTFGTHYATGETHLPRIVIMKMN